MISRNLTRRLEDLKSRFQQVWEKREFNILFVNNDLEVIQPRTTPGNDARIASAGLPILTNNARASEQNCELRELLAIRPRT